MWSQHWGYTVEGRGTAMIIYCRPPPVWGCLLNKSNYGISFETMTCRVWLKCCLRGTLKICKSYSPLFQNEAIFINCVVSCRQIMRINIQTHLDTGSWASSMWQIICTNAMWRRCAELCTERPRWEQYLRVSNLHWHHCHLPSPLPFALSSLFREFSPPLLWGWEQTKTRKRKSTVHAHSEEGKFSQQGKSSQIWHVINIQFDEFLTIDNFSFEQQSARLFCNH